MEQKQIISVISHDYLSKIDIFVQAKSAFVPFLCSSEISVEQGSVYCDSFVRDLKASTKRGITILIIFFVAS